MKHDLRPFHSKPCEANPPLIPLLAEVYCGIPRCLFGELSPSTAHSHEKTHHAFRAVSCSQPCDRGVLSSGLLYSITSICAADNVDVDALGERVSSDGTNIASQYLASEEGSVLDL